MGEQAVQRPRHPCELQGVDEQPRVSDLAAASRAHEAPQLLLSGPSSLGRLLLEGAERPELTLSVDDLFHRGGAEGADQLVLQVCDAHVEAERLHIGATEVGAEAGPRQTAAEVALPPYVTEARQSEVEPPRTEQIQETPDVRCTPDRHDGNSLGVQVPTTALSQRFERELVADPFDQHDST